MISLARSKSLLVAFPSFQVIIESSFANCYATTQCCPHFLTAFPISTHSWLDTDPDFTKSSLITICSFSGPGLFTQLVILRDEVISYGGEGAGLLTASFQRGGFPKLSVSQLCLKPTAWIAVNWATSHYPNRTSGKETRSK